MRRRRLWLVLAVVLLALSAWLLSDDGKAKPVERKMDFPRSLREPEFRRLEARRTQVDVHAPVAVPVAPHSERPAPEAKRRDPFLAAMPPLDEGGSALVLEANALVNSPIGTLLLGCLFGEEDLSPEALVQTTGVDLQQDVDRLGMSGDTIFASGNFAGLVERFNERSAYASDYGDKGRVYASPGEHANPGRRDGTYAGLWNNEVVVVGNSEASVKAALDRLDGRGEPTRPPIPEEETYGDLYGVLSPRDLAELIPADQKALREGVLQAIARATVHADASRDMAIVVELTGDDEAQVGDFARTLGAALSVARLATVARGDDDVAELLSYARVKPGNGWLQLEMALPLAFFEQRFKDCAAQREAAVEVP